MHLFKHFAMFLSNYLCFYNVKHFIIFTFMHDKTRKQRRRTSSSLSFLPAIQKRVINFEVDQKEAWKRMQELEGGVPPLEEFVAKPTVEPGQIYASKRRGRRN